MKRRSIRRCVVLWVFGSLIGALVIALPDDDRRIFSLSASHGPSAVDLLGIAIVIGAWLPILLLLWKARAALRAPWGLVTAVLGGAGALIVLGTIAADMGSAWMIGAALLIAAQLLVVATLGTAQRR